METTSPLKHQTHVLPVQYQSSNNFCKTTGYFWLKWLEAPSHLQSRTFTSQAWIPRPSWKVEAGVSPTQALWTQVEKQSPQRSSEAAPTRRKNTCGLGDEGPYNWCGWGIAQGVGSWEWWGDGREKSKQNKDPFWICKGMWIPVWICKGMWILFFRLLVLNYFLPQHKWWMTPSAGISLGTFFFHALALIPPLLSHTRQQWYSEPCSNWFLKSKTKRE